MNYSTSVFLINPHVRAILATYDEGASTGCKMFKTLDQSVAVGDFIVVPTTTRHNMTVMKVVEVDVDVDFDCPKQVDWVIATIDNTPFQKMLAEEAEAIKAIKSAEVRRKRDSLREAMFADHMETLKALPIADFSEPKAPEQNTAE